MELKDLCGEHLLSGVDFVDVTVREWGDRDVTCNAVRFRLDATTYTAAEDEIDGYRSHMRDLMVGDEPITNSWPSVRVTCSMAEKGQYGDSCEILEIRDVATGGVVLRVGTDNTNDYYPWFVSEFTPEALAHNASGAGKEGGR